MKKILVDLEACPHAKLLLGSCWMVRGQYIFVGLTPCGCFEWAGSSPQYVRDGAHIKPETLKLMLMGKDPGNAYRVNKQRGRP